MFILPQPIITDVLLSAYVGQVCFLTLQEFLVGITESPLCESLVSKSALEKNPCLLLQAILILSPTSNLHVSKAGILQHLTNLAEHVWSRYTITEL